MSVQRPQVAPAVPAAALGENMVRRLRAFAGMSRMKRLALVVLARTLTNRDVTKLRVRLVDSSTRQSQQVHVPNPWCPASWLARHVPGLENYSQADTRMAAASLCMCQCA